MKTRNDVKCPRKDCTINTGGVCTSLDRAIKIGSVRSTIDEGYIQRCPFFMTKEQKAKDYQYREKRLSYLKKSVRKDVTG